MSRNNFKLIWNSNSRWDKNDSGNEHVNNESVLNYEEMIMT